MKGGKRDVDCDKQIEKAVTAPNCVLKGSWGEGGSGGIRKKLKSEYTVTPYKCLGKISDILHLNNENNQLERRARPPKDVSLDAQSWTRAYDLSSRVVAVTTTTETS